MLEHYVMGPGITAGAPMPYRTSTNNNVGDGSVTVKQESDLLERVCASCNVIITDRFMMRVNDRNYHEECLMCAECSMPLTKTCHIRDYKLFCKDDYMRLYGAKCGRCGQSIGGKELVMKTGHGPIYHVDCFVCFICGQVLLQGAHYVLRQGQPICRREFENDMAAYSPQDDDLDDGRARDGRRGPKRPRTILTSVQRRQFKASFEVSPKPCRKVREALAKETGLSVRVVQVWFQNQRAKMKKLQRKAKTDQPDKDAKEDRKADSPQSDHSRYLNAMRLADGESSGFSSATQPLNPNLPYSPDDAFGGHSNDSFCSSELSMDGTEAGFEIGDNDGNATDGNSHHNSTSSLGANSEMPSLSHSLHNAMHNPIDKLFMMQSSYFNADHV